MKQGIWVVIAACSVLMAAFMIYRTVRPPLDELPETGASIEGTITYNGNPVPQALVVVAGEDRSANSFLSTPGKYQVQNVPLGEVKIAVNTQAAFGRMRADVMRESKGKADPNAGSSGFVSVPEKYASPATSGIVTTIKEGTNVFEINIKD